MSAAQLRAMLLNTADLGPDYRAQPADSNGKKRDDVGMSGCPALDKLEADGDTKKFAAEAEVSYDYTLDSGSELGETLDSDSPAKLSGTLRDVFAAYAACPSFTVTSGSSPIQVTTAKVTLPKLGDEQYGNILTMIGGEKTTVIKEVAVRRGNITLMLSGAPGLVDTHLVKALAKLDAQR